MKMFRGENVAAWQARLMQLGWPDLAAEDMAHFLVGDDTQLEAPRWANLLAADEALRDLARADDKVMAVFKAGMERERKRDAAR